MALEPLSEGEVELRRLRSMRRRVWLLLTFAGSAWVGFVGFEVGAVAGSSPPGWVPEVRVVYLTVIGLALVLSLWLVLPPGDA